MKTITTIAYAAAVALAIFGGTISVAGMMNFAPGAMWVIAFMGGLFEVSKLIIFTLLGMRLSVFLKAPLLVAGLALMGLNIVGLSGFLSNHFEQQQIAANATNRTAEVEASAVVAALERQVKAAEDRIAKATDAMAKARGDRDQIKAIKAIIVEATAERNRAADALAVAQGKQAKAEGATIAATGEMASIIALAALTGTDVPTVAHRVFLVVGGLPEVLEALLTIAAGMLLRQRAKAAPVVVEAPAEPAKPTRDYAAASRKGWQKRRKNDRLRAKARKTGPQLAVAN